MEYTAPADGADDGPVRGRRLSLPVQLIVQPALRVRTALHIIRRPQLIFVGVSHD